MNINFELARAVKAHDIEGVVSLIRAGACANTVDPNNNEHILLNAARRGYSRIASLLIDHGAEINVTSENTGNTPLIEAAIKGHVKVVRGLLEYKPDLTRQNHLGLNACAAAERAKQDKIVALIRAETAFWADVNATPSM